MTGIIQAAEDAYATFAADMDGPAPAPATPPAAPASFPTATIASGSAALVTVLNALSANVGSITTAEVVVGDLAGLFIPGAAALAQAAAALTPTAIADAQALAPMLPGLLALLAAGQAAPPSLPGDDLPGAPEDSRGR